MLILKLLHLGENDVCQESFRPEGACVPETTSVFVVRIGEALLRGYQCVRPINTGMCS